MDKIDYEFIRWSVDARKVIQLAILNLSHSAERPNAMHNEPLGSRYIELAAVAFSLWRAAFLASMGAPPLTNTSGEGKSEAKVDHAATLLKTILASNAVTFADDRRAQSWMGEYYLDNASMRLRRYVNKHVPMVHADVRRLIEYVDEQQVPASFVSSAFAWNIIFSAFARLLSQFLEDMSVDPLVKIVPLDNADYKFKPRPASLGLFISG